MPINALVDGLEARNKSVFGCNCSCPRPLADLVVAELAEAPKHYQCELFDRMATITAEYAVSMDIVPQTCFAAIL